MEQHTPPSLMACSLSKSIGGRQVIRDVNLVVERGAVYYLVGNNGEGKTTLLRLLAGLLRPTSGSIRVSGVPIWPGPAMVLSKLGIVPADGGYYPNLTVAQNVRLAAVAGSRENPGAGAGTDAIDLLGLRTLLDRKATALSKGQKKRLAIACVLARQPEALLLDEPFADLDETAMTLVQGMVTTVRARAGTAVVIGTVLPPDGENEAASVGILCAGRLVEERFLPGGVRHGLVREMLRRSGHLEEETAR